MCLIVLVPEALAGSQDLAREATSRAAHEQRNILYLALVDSLKTMSRVSSGIAKMKDTSEGNGVRAFYRLTETNRWLETLREVYQPRDEILCNQEQIVRSSFMRTTPVSEFIHSALNAPTLIVSGYYHPRQDQAREWPIFSWFGLDSS